MSEGRMRGRRGGGDRGDRGEQGGERRRAPRGNTPGIPDPPVAPDAATLLEGTSGEIAVADVGLPADVDVDAPLPPSGQPGDHRPVDLNSLYRMTNLELLGAAQRLNVEGASSMRKQDLIFEVMKAQ